MKIIYKINLAPFGAAVLFFIIFIMAWILGKRTENRLTRIETGYFPALEMSRDLEENLAVIQRSMLDASTSGDQDKLLKADAMRDALLERVRREKENVTLDIVEMTALEKLFQDYYSLARETTVQMISEENDVGLFANLKKMQEDYNAIKKTIQDLNEQKRADMAQAFVDSRNSHATLMRVIMIFTLFVMGALVAGIWLGRSIGRSIQAVVSIMKDIAQGEGDLTKRIKTEADDELGELARWFNTFVNKLHDIISRVMKNTEKVASAVATITATASQMAAGAEEHNAQAGEVSASVEEMSASIMQNSQNAGSTARIAEGAGTKARQGAQAMQTTKKGMEEIVLSTQTMDKIIKSLTDRALQIGKITEVIDKIADQTNLLALNAAVEAARAGDQGSGFAVVADEVRKLAERTATATREISETIQAIQKDTMDASESMNETVTVVDSGRAALESTERILAEIFESVTQSVDMIQQIAAASEEQSAGAEEISSSVDEMNNVSRQTSEGAEHMSATAQELSTQTEALWEVVNMFKLQNGKLN
ncbi:methyl-accepting chemotaxis protein [bacterium]|nr:methyl-accepting chemotaxis protein [bacterium]